MVNGWYSSLWSFLACSILTTSLSRSRAAQMIDGVARGQGHAPAVAGMEPVGVVADLRIWPPNRSA